MHISSSVPRCRPVNAYTTVFLAWKSPTHKASESPRASNPATAAVHWPMPLMIRNCSDVVVVSAPNVSRYFACRATPINVSARRLSIPRECIRQYGTRDRSAGSGGHHNRGAPSTCGAGRPKTTQRRRHCRAASAAVMRCPSTAGSNSWYGSRDAPSRSGANLCAACATAGTSADNAGGTSWTPRYDSANERAALAPEPNDSIRMGEPGASSWMCRRASPSELLNARQKLRPSQ